MSKEPTEQENQNDDPKEDLYDRLDLPDGPGGILTKSDRIYFLHDSPQFPDLEWEGDDTQKRWRIRQKIKNALWDFELLQYLPQSELDLILDDVFVIDEDDSGIATIRPYGRTGPYLGPQFHHLVSTMLFLYRACDSLRFLDFEELVEETVRRGVPSYRDESPSGQGQRAKNVDIDVSIDVDIEWENVFDADGIEQKLERGEPLTRAEVGELFLHGRVERGDLSADDVDPDLFRGSTPGGYGADPLPGLDPSKPSPRDGWQDRLEQRLPDEMIEVVDFETAERPEDVWEQLEEEFDDPIGKAMAEGDA